MKPDISEFSFGYALTEDLVTWAGSPVTAAPIFPSLIKEGSPGGGFDLRLELGGVPLFLQFKLTDCMVRRNSREIADGLLNPPLYRMHLRPRKHSRQHDLLLALEAAGSAVYYAAPVFHTPAELNAVYLNQQTIQNSRFIAPSAIGLLPDDEPHHVSFADVGPAWFLSQPTKIQGSISSDALARQLFDRIRHHGDRAVSADRLQELLEAMLRIASEIPQVAAQASQFTADARFSKRRLISRIAFLAQTMFDCAFLIARLKNGEAGPNG